MVGRLVWCLGTLGLCAALDVHVCASVDDTSAQGIRADGSAGRPFGSVERARDHLRAHPRRHTEHHRVLVRGVHELRRPFALDARDAGTADSTVTYMSWPRERGGDSAPAQMTGGVVLPASAFVPAASAAATCGSYYAGTSCLKSVRPAGTVCSQYYAGPSKDEPAFHCKWNSQKGLCEQDRLCSTPTHSGVLVADLFAHGINASDLGALGHPYPSTKLELFYGGKPMDLARDPNIGTDPLRTWHWAGYENATGPVGKATGATSIGFIDGARAARWAAAAADSAHGADLWLHGYFKYDWRDTFVRVASVDVAGAELQLDPTTPPQYEAVKGCRFYAVNALPLLDAPGEYYVDAPHGKLYFLPPSGRVEEQVLVSVLPSVLAVDGANHTSFEGLTITAAQGTVATLSGVASVFVRNSTVSNGGGSCVSLHGADSAVEGCTVFGCGASGISIAGGSVTTLAHGNVSLTGSHVANFSRVRRTYTPGLGFSGAGLYVGGNKVEHGPHTAIQGGGNDNMFEHNTISHIAFECTDTGAFYVGRSWAQRGNVARYNSFDTIRPTERLAQQSCSQNAFYLDDEMSGWKFYGNIIRNSTTGVLIGGGRRNVVRNNTFIDNDNDIHFDNRGMNWQHKSCLANCTLDPTINTTTSCLLHTLEQLNYKNPPYSTHYPELLTIFEDSPCVPVYTIIADNRYCHTNSKGGGRFLDATDAQVQSWKSTSVNNTEDCR